MLFDLQKAVALLAMPLGLVWLLLLALVLWSWRLRRPGFSLALSLVWILLGLAGNPWLGHRLMARLERQVPAPDPRLSFEAVCVLGGGTEVDEDGTPHLARHGDRLAEAARLWHAGRARCLVASGASRDSRQGERNLGEEARRIWLGLGVPESAIRVLAVPCFNTREEIAAYRSLREREGWTRLGLLSSASHLPRALRLARKAGLQASPLPCDREGRPRRFRVQDLVPQQEGLGLAQTALWEMLGQALGR